MSEAVSLLVHAALWLTALALVAWPYRDRLRKRAARWVRRHRPRGLVASVDALRRRGAG